MAEEIEENTPFSFKQLEEVKSLFTKQSPESLKAACLRLESLSCMPLLPAELFFYSFPGEIECPNPECANSLTWRRDKSGEYLPLAPLVHGPEWPSKDSPGPLDDASLKVSSN